MANHFDLTSYDGEVANAIIFSINTQIETKGTTFKKNVIEQLNLRNI